MKQQILTLLTILLLATSAAMAAPKDKGGAMRIKTERLPDLTVGRTFHSTLCMENGELVVIGGHESGFVPTATAEYFADGKWHLLKTVYTHDAGMTVQLKSGEAIIAGGFEKDLGIGQIFSVERYDPKTHRFEGFGCLDTRRAWAEGVELDSGRVVISGNWYHTDGLETFDGKKLFTFADTVSRQRVNPFMFRTARDNVMVLGQVDTKGNRHADYPTTADRLKGGPVEIALLKTWQPIPLMMEHRPTESFIGDEKREIYAYLMAMMNREDKIAIALVRNGEITLMPTTKEVPMVVDGKQVFYTTTVITDRTSGRGYMMGFDNDGRRYLIIIDYARALDGSYRLNGTAAPLTVGYTDKLEGLGEFVTPVVMPNGDLFVCGGSLNRDNFTAGSGAWLLKVGRNEEQAGWWGYWWLVAVALLLAIVAYGAYKAYKPQKSQEPQEPQKSQEPQDSANLMKRIEHLMEEQQLFLRSDLKLADVAVELNTNSSYITNCIRQQRDCTFPQLVAAYRVEYAKKLMTGDSSMKFASVCIASGFSNETTFFRTFKRITGLTPSEWVTQKEKS